MELRPINTISNILTGGQSVTLQGQAPVKAIVLAYYGSMTSGTCDFDYLTGNINIAVHGDKSPTGDRASVHRPQTFVSLADAFGGRALSESAAAGDFLHVLPIWFGLPDDDNCLFVRRGQRLQVFPSVFDSTNVSSASCQVYAFLDRGCVNRYNMIHEDESVPIGGKKIYPLTSEGLAALVMSPASTTDNDSFALLDGQERLIWGDRGPYRGVFQSMLKIEGAMFKEDVIVDTTRQGRNLWNGVKDNLNLELNGGSGKVWVHQVIIDKHVGGALEESLEYRAGGQEAVRSELSESGISGKITEALVPQPSLSPSIGTSAPIPQPSGGAEYSAPVPRKRTALPVQPGSGGVLKRIR